MEIKDHIDHYLNSLSEPKRSDMLALHHFIQTIAPTCKLWFSDGRNSDNKIVSNPNIGYGLINLIYADGKSRPFYQIGISANTTGISIYIMGIKDKTYLAQTFGTTIGKAGVSGYCIKFKKLKDINLEILEAVIRFGFENQADKKT